MTERPGRRRVWYSSIERGEPIFAWNFAAGADRYTGAGASGWQSILALLLVAP